MARIEPGEIRKKGKVPKNANLFFTIFQTFMCSPGQAADGPGIVQASPGTTIVAESREAYFDDYPADFFDFIVIDECHRGGANDESTWRDILNHFAPAVQLGLTATPKRKDNIDTYAYFGEPVFTYSLKEGINDGFLTPFRVKQIQTTLDEYVYTPDDELIEGDVEAGKRYTESDFNKIIGRKIKGTQLIVEQRQSRNGTVENVKASLRRTNSGASSHPPMLITVTAEINELRPLLIAPFDRPR